MRTVGLAGLCLVALCLGACFETPTADISFRCGPAGECPDNYECRDDGCCHLIGSSNDATCELPPDAAVPGPDAMLADAMTDAMPADAMTDAMPDAMPDAIVDAGPVGMLMSLLPANALFDVGQTADFTVTLTALAPAGGTVVTLMSSDAAVATVPATLTVPEGVMSASFAATGIGAGTATISAILGMDQLDATATVAATSGAAGDVVISEFLAVSSSGNNRGEFIEVVNASAVTINIAGWMLTSDMIDNSIVASSLNAAEAVYLGPGDTVYGVPNPVDPMDIPMDADFVYGPAGAAFELNDAGSMVRIGDGVTDIDIVDFSGWETGASATPLANQFAGLLDLSTQLDSGLLAAADNDDGGNWCVPLTATPGAANSPCDAAIIDEFLADAYGPDTDLEFIELRVVAGADLSGFRVRTTDANGVLTGADYTLPAGTRAPLDRLLVIADNSGGATAVANADIETVLGLPDNDAGLQLLTPANTAADAIGYGALVATVDGVDGLPIVETAAATGAQGSSLARASTGADTGDNAADVHVDPTPTPGVISDAVSVSVLGTSPADGVASLVATVAVTGTDLVHGAQFTVGAATATCTVTNATSADCTFPENGGTAATVDVTAQNPDGGVGTLTGGFTYTGVLADPGATFWCNTQFPPTATTTVGAATENIYGQIYVSGMTDADNMPVTAIASQVGYGADAADPTLVNFTWIDATPNPGYDFDQNNDEHQAAITPTAIGTYDYAYRFSLDGGLNYYYCDTSGSDDGYAPANAGSLTVN